MATCFSDPGNGLRSDLCRYAYTHKHTHIRTGAMVVPVSWTSEKTNGLSSGWSLRKSSSILLSLYTPVSPNMAVLKKGRSLCHVCGAIISDKPSAELLDAVHVCTPCIVPENSRCPCTIVGSYAQRRTATLYTLSYSEHAHKLASQHGACCCFSYPDVTCFTPVPPAASL